MSNEFDAAVTASLQPSGAQAARVGFSAASDTNPDAYAEAQRVARRTGVPVDTVFAMPAEIKRQDAIGSIDFDSLAKDSPSTAALLADVEKAKISHDDVDALSGIERVLSVVKNSGRAVAASVPQMNAGLWGMAAAPFELAGSDGIGGYLRDQQRITKNMAKAWGPQGESSGNIESGWYSGLTSAGQNLLSLPLAFMPGGQGAALTSMVAPVFGESYGKARDAGLSPLQGISYGTQDAVAEYAGEKLGLGSLVKNVKAGSGFGKTIIDYLVREVPSEMATTVAQSFNEYANINPNKPVGEWVRQLPDELAQTVVATLVGGGAITTTVKVADKAISVIAGKQQDAQQTSQMGEMLIELNKLSEASKLRGRDTETAQAFFQSIMEEGSDAVFITPEALAQSGLAEKMAQAIPAVAEQLQTAAESGHDIRIPLADLMANMAGPELEQSILPHVAIEPGGFTQTTAQEYLQSDQAKELQAEVERVMTEKQGDDTFKASAEVVRSDIKAQLDTAARFTPQVNDAYSAMVGNFYAVQAARIGTTPEELFKRYPLKVGAESVAAGDVLNQPVWHGSPFKFDKFSLDHMGKGEGAQAFGWGLYFAGDKAVAEWYRDNLSSRQGANASEQKFAGKTPMEWYQHWSDKADRSKDPTEFYDRMSMLENLELTWNPSAALNTARDEELSPAAIKWFEDTIAKEFERPGATYQVEIPEDDAMLLWDKPLSEQSDKVRAAVEATVAEYENLGLGADLRQSMRDNESSESFYRLLTRTAGSDKNASRDLNRNGAHGIKYLDGSSRTGGEGSYNYVIFDDSAIQILQTYYQNQQAPRGSFNPATLQITLLKNADLSTFLHESGHFFLEVQADLAGKLQQDANVFGLDTLKPGEQQLLKDMQATLEWFGVKDLAEWNGLDFEEKRSYHEKFARGFEAYLFEGKAPSIELQGLFQRFRAWMLRVYKELKALNVELSDEVRGVFDCMLATNEQITLAEQGRSMMPLFSTPEQAGMTTDEFAAYQALGVDATNEAIEDLQARGLRDMQWIKNARGRIIKQLQRDAKDQRAAVEMDVRREVMSQPIYRAWTFLTAKQSRDDMLDSEKARADYREAMSSWNAARMDAETEARKNAKQEAWAASEEGRKKYRRDGSLAKAQQRVLKREEKAIEGDVEKVVAKWEAKNPKPADPDARPKSSPDSVDETRDSLFAAIGKLGGIDKADVLSAWGIDPADKPTSGVFGKPLWRREGGLSIDGMAEALSQYGYLTLDENGKWDIRELEEKFKSELGGDAQLSNAYDYAADQQQDETVANPGGLSAGRLEMQALATMGLPVEVVNAIKARKMTAKAGLHPDIVAELFGFSSGDELVRKLAAAETPKAEIDALTDVRMLEQFGDLSSQQSIEKTADKAIHNDVRARMISTEANILAKSTGQRKVLASAAKEYAAAMISRLIVRNIKPGQYASAEVRAAKAAEKASKSGDMETAAAEKRNQLINAYATRAAYDAQDEIERAVRYLKKFENASTRAGLDIDYTDQIDTLLERFDLRKVSNKQIDRLTGMRTWVQSQLNAGEIPQIAESLLTKPERAAYIAQIESRGPDGELVYADDEERIKLLADAIDRSEKRSFKTMTVEEFRGLVDTIKQIEHLGRLKHKMMTARDDAAYEVVRDSIAGSIAAEAKSSGKNTRTANDWLGQKLQAIKQFGAAHIKVATWARIMDGGKENGPVWRYIVQPANERSSQETTMRAEATAKLDAIMRPILDRVPMADKIGKGKFFSSIGDSLNWQERFAIALNLGNESNTQRLLDGKGWTMAQIKPVLDTLTAEEWRAAQAVWDHFEEYRPLIASKELRVSGKEPEWIPARQITVQTADGQTVTLRGGYYPVVYDARVNLKASQHSSSEEAKNLLKASYSAATTRRSFTKSRVEEVSGRPLLLNMQGLYSGVNDVIHDLAWHEWVMDANKLLRTKTIDTAIREHYGPEVKREFEKWRDDIVAGNRRLDHAIEKAAGWARQSVSASALTFNILSAAMQPLGLANSISRVGASWIGKGVARYVAAPREATREAQQKSEWMANRTRTRFRELNELRNQVQGQTAVREMMGRYGYWMMMKAQMMVDVPTWWGAYEKAIADGHDERTAINLADQSVKDSQGGGEEVDQSGVERGGPLVKLFTAFYGFMGTTLNTSYLNVKTESSKAKMAVNLLLVLGVPAVVGSLLKDALVPGDAGDDDEQGKKLLIEQLSFLAGLVAFGREFAPIIKTVAGEAKGQSYSGPAGLRIIPDSIKLAQQAGQGEFDEAFRKAFVNVLGDITGVPSVQINRTITGAEALANGDTENPAALAFGFQRPH